MDNISYLEILQGLECRDATYISRNPSLVLGEAKGSLIWDVQGKEYIDLASGFGALALGHNDDHLLQVMRDYLGGMKPGIAHGLGDVYASKAKIELMQRLSQYAPQNLKRISLSISGAGAVETAIKTAMLYTGKSGIVAFQGAYHGVDLGIVSLSHDSRFREPFARAFPEDRVAFAEYAGNPHSLRQQMTLIFAEQKRLKIGTAAVIVEPIQGRSGVRIPGIDWLRTVKEICESARVPLIFDEIFTGFGRTGRMLFADEVTPDLLCVGKALGGGFPLSACLGSEKLMAAWPQNEGEAIHTGTFFGHPLSCVVASEFLSQLKKRKLIDRSAELGTWFKNLLRTKLEGIDGVKEIRGDGLMLAVEFKRDFFGAEIADRLRAEGFIVIPSGEKGRGISFSPALNIPQEYLEKLTFALQKILTS